MQGMFFYHMIKFLKHLWQEWRSYRVWKKEWERRYDLVMKASREGTKEEFKEALEYWNSLKRD